MKKKSTILKATTLPTNILLIFVRVECEMGSDDHCPVVCSKHNSFLYYYVKLKSE